jgi:hypothetical protein
LAVLPFNVEFVDRIEPSRAYPATLGLDMSFLGKGSIKKGSVMIEIGSFISKL